MATLGIGDNTTFQNGSPDSTSGGFTDAQLHSANPTTNYGSTAALSCRDTSSTDVYMWFKPDLSGIPAGKTIDSATLYLYLELNTIGASRVTGAYGCKQNADPTQLTWNEYSTGNSWATAGALNTTSDIDAAATGTVDVISQVNQYVAIDVTDWVSDAYSGARSNYGLIVKWTAQSTGVHQYDSSEGNNAERPELLVTYSDASVEVTPGAGSAVLTGATPSLAVTANHTVDTGVGSAVLTGATPTLAITANHFPAPGTDSLSLDGLLPTITLTEHWYPAPGAGSATITGETPTLAKTEHHFPSPGAGAATITGETPTLAKTEHHWVDVPAGSITGLGYAATILENNISTPPAGTLAFAGLQPSVMNPSHEIYPGVGSLEISGWAPGGTNTNIATHYSQYTLRGKAPTINVTSDISINVPAGSLTVSPHNPGLDGFAIPQVGRATLAGYAPNVATTASQSAIAVTTIQWSIDGGLTFWPQNVTVTIGDAIVGIGVGTGQYSFTGYAPSLAFTNTIDVAQDALAFTGQVPTVVRSFTLTDIESVSSTIVNSYGAISHIEDNLISLSSPMDKYGGAATEISTIRGVYPVYSKINPGPISRRSNIAG